MPLLYLRDFSINFIALQGYIRHTLNKTNIAFCVRTEYHTGDKEIRGDFMEFSQIYLIVGGVLGGLLLITLVILFFVSRKSQKVMQSLLTLMTRPESARVQDAVRVLNAILADEMIKMDVDKVIVVLTRPLEYRKKKSNKRISKWYYKRYPNYIDTLNNRYKMYNDEVEKVISLEKEKKIFVIRPSRLVDIKRIERDTEKLKEMYDLGVEDAKNSLNDLRNYLKIKE